MKTYNFDSDYGKVYVEEYTQPYSNEVIEKVLGLAKDNLRPGYEENYLDTDNTASLGYLLRNGHLKSLYVLYVDGVFKFFSSTRTINDDQTFLCLVRTFSDIDKIKKPWHLSYILSLQIQFAISQGYKEVTFTANAGAKDGVANVILKRYMNYTSTPNQVKALALENVLKFKYLGIQMVNYCEQHVFTAQTADFVQ